MKISSLDSKKQKTLYTALQVALPLTFVFKMWYFAELQYNSTGIALGSIIGRILAYAISGAVSYLFALLAVSLSYNSFSRSKYCPCDEMSVCIISKRNYSILAYSVISIANIVCGLLNFVAFLQPISTSFIVILTPIILSIFAIISLVGLLSLECKKGEFKQLLTAMAWPCIILLLLLR